MANAQTGLSGRLLTVVDKAPCGVYGRWMRRAFLVPVGLALAALSPQAGLAKSGSPEPGTLAAFPAMRTSRTDEASGKLTHALLALPRAIRSLASAAGHYSHSSHVSHASHASGSGFGHVSHASHASHASSSTTPLAPPGSPRKSTTTTAQAVAIVFKATLTVGQERPHPNGPLSGAIGHFHATLVGTTLKWTLTNSHLSGLATAARIHSGVWRGEVGPVAASLCGPCSRFETGAVTLTQAQISDLLAGRAYVNIETSQNSNGEVRGQITRG
jgi:hypothetical protein